MGYLYSVLGWGIVALGVVHMTATFRFFGSLTGAAIWFFTGGIAMVLAGALDLLNRAYGAAAPGLRWFCVATNVTMTALGERRASSERQRAHWRDAGPGGAGTGLEELILRIRN